MALSTNINFKGIQVTNAYIRVINFAGNKTTLGFTAGMYGPIGENGERQLLDSVQWQCTHNVAGDNPIKQAYQFLKTLPEFSNATDC